MHDDLIPRLERYLAERGDAAGRTMHDMHPDVLIAAALDALRAEQWQPIETAPIDGSDFLALLSNGWRIIMHGDPRWSGTAAFEWWRTGSLVHVPYEPSHPTGTRWEDTRTVRALKWRPLPPPPSAPDA